MNNFVETKKPAVWKPGKTPHYNKWKNVGQLLRFLL